MGFCYNVSQLQPKEDDDENPAVAAVSQPAGRQGRGVSVESARTAPEQARAGEQNIENLFYGFHAMEAQPVNIGSCAAVPVAGCQCAFCTQLRQAGR